VNGTPTEVQYYQGQRLTATLFRTEQAYHVTMRERHNLAGHDWGIALGLELSAGYVEAGYAIDGYGRELILPARTSFPLDIAFDSLGTDSLDISLVYNRSVESPGDYVVETPVIQVDRAQGPGTDRRQPKVAPGDENFGPTRTAPQDNVHPAPVYLGTITRDPTVPANPPVVSGAGDRPYVGARAAQVFTPAGDAHLDLGTEVTVYAGTSASPALRWTPDDAGPARLEVGGALTVGGDLGIDGGRLVMTQVSASGAGTHPGWQLDRVTTTASGKTVEQLRLVLGNPVDSGSETEFVIGCFANGQFKPCLTVAAADGTVTVHGNLVVEGAFDPKGGCSGGGSGGGGS
jgi:hypothetical protein